VLIFAIIKAFIVSIHTYFAFPLGSGSKDTPGRGTIGRPSSKNSVLVFLVVSSSHKHCDEEQLPHFLQLLEHHGVWLEHLFESSNTLDALEHLTVRVMYFYSRGETVKSGG